LQAVAAGALLLAAAAPVAVAGTSPAGSVAGVRAAGAGVEAPVGNDISWPQCGSHFPTGPAFGIVGVNGGVADDGNPCFGPHPGYEQSELYWAVAASSGVASVSKASLYVNTDDPGSVVTGTPVTDWPTSGATTPFGACVTKERLTNTGTLTLGQTSQACAWEYGYQRARQDATWLKKAADAIDAETPPVHVADAAGDYPWWLDVETANTWPKTTTGQEMNAADLQGMITGLRGAGATEIGVYSTSYQWTKITGGSRSGALEGIPDWIPGAGTLTVAKAHCTLDSFTGGRVELTQWTTTIDSDYACTTSGYDLVGADGGVFVFSPPGTSGGFYGSLPGIGVVPAAPVVGLVPTVSDQGYFLVGADGGVFAFGTAPFLGSLPGDRVTPVQPITGIVAADTDRGYFLVGRDGGVFAFGTVPFSGSLPGEGIAVDDIIGIASTPSGNGYWLVSATGTVYAFGAAQKLGTAKGTPSPVSAIAGTPTGGGYWISTKGGAVYNFGDARKFTTLPALGVSPALPVIGIVRTANTGGYWLIGADGGVFAFGDAGFVGSLPLLTVQVTDIVGAAPTTS
jgi:hypothetical protein